MWLLPFSHALLTWKVVKESIVSFPSTTQTIEFNQYICVQCMFLFQHSVCFCAKYYSHECVKAIKNELLIDLSVWQIACIQCGGLCYWNCGYWSNNWTCVTDMWTLLQNIVCDIMNFQLMKMKTSVECIQKQKRM